MKIKISHLAPGVHEFESQMKSDVFGMEVATIFRDPVDINVVLQKFQQHLVVDLTVKTVAHFHCDRCLDEFTTDLNTKDRITFSMNADLLHDTHGEIRELGSNDFEIDLTSDIREILLLAIPAKAVCKTDCAGICAGCGANLNHEECKCPKSNIDPRWDVLKQLIN